MAEPTVKTLAVWGVQTRPTGLVEAEKGFLTSIEESREMMTGTETNELGAVIGQHMYDRKKSLVVTVVAAATAKPPEMGADVAIDETKFYVTGVTVTESNNDFRKFRISCERYDSCFAVNNVAKEEVKS